MKKILFFATAFLLFVAFSANAQQRGSKPHREQMTPEQQAARLVERMNKELTLTEQQQSELKTWFTTSLKQRNENFKKNKDNRENMREEMKKEREATNAELKKVLTAEQYKTYKANEEKRQQERKERGGQHRPGNH